MNATYIRLKSLLITAPILENIYTIRYEDLFENNYYNLKELINKIGIKYDDTIFDNTKYTNVIIPNTRLVDAKPKNTDHSLYRTCAVFVNHLYQIM